MVVIGSEGQLIRGPLHGRHSRSATTPHPVACAGAESGVDGPVRGPFRRGPRPATLGSDQQFVAPSQDPVDQILVAHGETVTKVDQSGALRFELNHLLRRASRGRGFPRLATALIDQVGQHLPRGQPANPLLLGPQRHGQSPSVSEILRRNAVTLWLLDAARSSFYRFGHASRPNRTFPRGRQLLAVLRRRDAIPPPWARAWQSTEIVWSGLALKRGRCPG